MDESLEADPQWKFPGFRNVEPRDIVLDMTLLIGVNRTGGPSAARTVDDRRNLGSVEEVRNGSAN